MAKKRRRKISRKVLAEQRKDFFRAFWNFFRLRSKKNSDFPSPPEKFGWGRCDIFVGELLDLSPDAIASVRCGRQHAGNGTLNRIHEILGPATANLNPYVLTSRYADGYEQVDTEAELFDQLLKKKKAKKASIEDLRSLYLLGFWMHSKKRASKLPEDDRPNGVFSWRALHFFVANQLEVNYTFVYGVRDTSRDLSPKKAEMLKSIFNKKVDGLSVDVLRKEASSIYAKYIN